MATAEPVQQGPAGVVTAYGLATYNASAQSITVPIQTAATTFAAGHDAAGSDLTGLGAVGAASLTTTGGVTFGGSLTAPGALLHTGGDSFQFSTDSSVPRVDITIGNQYIGQIACQGTTLYLRNNLGGGTVYLYRSGNVVIGPSGTTDNGVDQLQVGGTIAAAGAKLSGPLYLGTGTPAALSGDGNGNLMTTGGATFGDGAGHVVGGFNTGGLYVNFSSSFYSPIIAYAGATFGGQTVHNGGMAVGGVATFSNGIRSNTGYSDQGNGTSTFVFNYSGRGVTIGDEATSQSGNVIDMALPTAFRSSSNVGFYGANPVAQPSITGSKSGGAALASLLSALVSLGLITDNTTA